MLSINNNPYHNQHNSVTFKGMSPTNVKRFIPQLSEETATLISKELDIILPREQALAVMDKSAKELTVSIKTPDFTLPIGCVTYPGKDTVLEKISFLHEIANRIKTGTLFK